MKKRVTKTNLIFHFLLILETKYVHRFLFFFLEYFLFELFMTERDSHNYYLYALFSTNDPIMQLLHFLIIIELTTYNDQEVLC